MKDYVHSHGVAPDQQESIGWMVIPILQFLTGLPWDQFALNFVYAHRPTMIRVILPNMEQKTDACTGRVTVYYDHGLIESIEQEVEVGLDGGYKHGHDLWLEAQGRGIL